MAEPNPSWRLPGRDAAHPARERRPHHYLALKREVGFRWVEEYIWHKTTSAPGKWKYRFRDAWERIIHFSKTKEIKMRQDAVKAPIGDWTEKRLRNMSKNDRQRQESATNSKIGRPKTDAQAPLFRASIPA